MPSVTVYVSSYEQYSSAMPIGRAIATRVTEHVNYLVAKGISFGGSFVGFSMHEHDTGTLSSGGWTLTYNLRSKRVANNFYAALNQMLEGEVEAIRITKTGVTGCMSFQSYKVEIKVDGITCFGHILVRNAI